MNTFQKAVFTTMILMAVGGLSKVLYDLYRDSRPQFSVGECVTSNGRGEAWEIGFIHRVDQIGKKKYKTTTLTTNVGHTTIFESDLDFFIQSYYVKVPCPKELSR